MKPELIKGKAFVSIFKGVVSEGLNYQIPDWQTFFNRQLAYGTEGLTLHLAYRAELALDLIEKAGLEVVLISPAPGRFRNRIEGYLSHPANLLNGYNGRRRVILKPWGYEGSESDADWTAAIVASEGGQVFIGPKDVAHVLEEIRPQVRCFEGFWEAGQGDGPLARFAKIKEEEGVEVPNHAA